ncbi:MAG: alpha/beta hydrolase [Archangiaceae bacterium]|nr:alpha/beta hydrolase [Archangiaceae bacterium]
MKRVSANGLEFAYLEWGDAGHPLMLLFHGFPDTAHGWQGAAPQLAALGYRVVAPNMRGYAPTSVPERHTTSRDLGEDVVALIGALGAEKAVIVGHDWGAEAVTAAVGLAPSKVDRLVAVAIPHRTQLPKSLKVAWGARHFVDFNLPGALGRLSARDFARVDQLCTRWSPTWRLTPEDTRAVKEAFAAPGSAEAAIGYYRGASALTPPFMKERIAVPTLAVAGADDPLLEPADFERARRHFTGRYEVAAIPGGHFCHRESPQAFVEAVAKFLGSPR